MNKKLILLIGILNFVQVYTIPENLTRLVLTGPQGTLIKTVDLIGDSHLPFLDLVKHPSSRKKSKELLQKDELESLTYAERTFMITLREMNQIKRKEPIEIFWELALNRYEYEKRPVINFLTVPFMKLAGERLQTEFQKNPQSSLKIIDSDTYRSAEILDIFNPQLEFLPVISATKVSESSKNLYDLLNPKISPVSVDLNKLQEKNPESYRELNQMWLSLSDKLNAFLNKYITPYLQKNPNITVSDLHQNLTHDFNLTEDDLSKLEDYWFDIESKLTNLEMLINVFLSDAEHIIVYAGAWHINGIIKQLTQNFNFKLIFQIGYSNDEESVSSEEEFQFQLGSSAWEFLKRNPQQSYNVFRKKGPIIKKLRTEFAFELENIVERTDDGRIPAMEQWIKKGFAHHINAPNTRIKDSKPILADAIEKNDVPMTKLLLRYGANANSHYLTLKMQKKVEGVEYFDYEYVSVYDIAQENNNQEIVDLLKKHGAIAEFKRTN